MQATEKNLRGHLSGILSVAISSNGQRIVSGSLDRTVKVWDGATTECLHTLEGHPSAVWALAISGQGTRIVSGDDYGIVCLWDANEGTCMRTIEVRDNSDGVPVTISADGQTILAAGDGGVKMWDTESGALVRVLQGNERRCVAIAASMDGSRVIVSQASSINVWDAKSGLLLRRLEGHMEGVTCVAMSSDGLRVVTGSWDGDVKLWDPATGACLQTLRHKAPVVSVATSGEIIVSCSHERGAVMIWSSEGGQCLQPLSLEERAAEVKCVAISKDSSRIIGGSDLPHSAVGVWDVAARKPQRAVAFAMALHERLGAASLVRELEPELIRAIGVMVLAPVWGVADT
jgi:WD40 repeat protein